MNDTDIINIFIFYHFTLLLASYSSNCIYSQVLIISIFPVMNLTKKLKKF